MAKSKHPCAGTTKAGKSCKRSALPGIPACFDHAATWVRTHPREAVLARPHATMFSVGWTMDNGKTNNRAPDIVVAYVRFSPKSWAQWTDLAIDDAEVLFDQLFLAGHLTEPPAEPGPANLLHTAIVSLKTDFRSQQERWSAEVAARTGQVEQLALLSAPAQGCQ